MSTEMKKIIEPSVTKEYKGITLVTKIKKDPLGYFLNVGVKNKGYTWFSLVGDKVLFLNDARAIEYVFAENDKNYHKGKYNEGLRPLLGYGLFMSEDDLWRKQRREVAPIFALGNFPEFAKHMVAATDAMLQRWEKIADEGGLIDIHTETMRLTLDVVLRSLFHEESEQALLHAKSALGAMLRIAEQRIWSVVNLPLRLVTKIPKNVKVLRLLDEITQGFIDARKANKKYPEDLLSKLISTHGDTPEEQKLLRDNVLSFMLAGHETTANGLAWTFFELGRHTNIREKVVEEIDRVTKGQAPDMQMIKDLQYTYQAFCEALRIYPPVWTMSRKTLSEDFIPLEDGSVLRVPKNSTVMLCTYAAHRRENYWQDPEAFYPERFAPEKVKARPRFAWFPFGGGPRLCLGFRFAEVESVTVMSMVYSRFNLELVPGQQVQAEPIITLRPDRPVLFRIKRRK